MKEIVRALLRPGQTVTGCVTIQRRLAPGRYEVADASGRLSVVLADSTELWPAGVEVVVQNGRIAGLGHRLGKHRSVAV